MIDWENWRLSLSQWVAKPKSLLSMRAFPRLASVPGISIPLFLVNAVKVFIRETGRSMQEICLHPDLSRFRAPTRPAGWKVHFGVACSYHCKEIKLTHPCSFNYVSSEILQIVSLDCLSVYWNTNQQSVSFFGSHTSWKVSWVRLFA